MSGGHEESATSNKGFKLTRLRSALLDFAERLAILRNGREAEQVAEQLRH